MTTNLPFSSGEFDLRLQRAQECLYRANLDAMVLTTPANFRYFTGLDSQFWESPTRPWFLIVPTEGPAIAIVPSIAEIVMGRCAVGSVMTWPSPQPDDEGVSLLAATLNSLSGCFKKIGFELGRECTLRMPVLDFLRVRELLISEVVDASACIWEIRNIKSTAEISKIRQVCQVVSQSFAGLPALAQCGMSESEITRHLTLDILNRGVHHVPFMACASGPGGYDQIITRGSHRKLVAGDVMIIDVGATIDGYFCDFDRNYSVGPLSDKARHVHDAVWLATEAGINSARAGSTVHDLWQAMTRVLNNAGMRGNNVGRLGHGLGLQLTEPPSNSSNDHTVLQPGMVITIEPGMEYEPGKTIVHEENIAITEDGFAELLTIRAPREMWSIS